MTHTAKHTPGPWIVRRHEDSDTKDIRGASGEEIALCYAGDAALIAAAPAMYEALLDLVICPAFNSQVFEKDKESHRAWTLARAALAQAEGRTL